MGGGAPWAANQGPSSRAGLSLGLSGLQPRRLRMGVSASGSQAPEQQNAELPPTRPSSLLGEGSESAEAGLAGGLSTAALTAAAPTAAELEGASSAEAAAGAELVETVAAVADVAEGLVAEVQAACAAAPAQQPVLPAAAATVSAPQPAAAMAPPRSRDPRQRRKQSAPARLVPPPEGRTFGLLAVPVPPEPGEAGDAGVGFVLAFLPASSVMDGAMG